jgi:hypothetical protein
MATGRETSGRRRIGKLLSCARNISREAACVVGPLILGLEMSWVH